MKLKLISILLISFSSGVFACQCEENSTDPVRAFDKYPHVAFVAACEVHLEMRKYKASQYNSNTGKWRRGIFEEKIAVADAHVIFRLKGNPPKTIKLNAGSPNSNCHHPIAIGREYMAFIDEEGVAYISMCSPTGSPRMMGNNFWDKHKEKLSNKQLNADDVCDVAG